MICAYSALCGEGNLQIYVIIASTRKKKTIRSQAKLAGSKSKCAWCTFWYLVPSRTYVRWGFTGVNPWNWRGTKCSFHNLGRGWSCFFPFFYENKERIFWNLGETKNIGGGGNCLLGLNGFKPIQDTRQIISIPLNEKEDIALLGKKYFWVPQELCKTRQKIRYPFKRIVKSFKYSHTPKQNENNYKHSRISERPCILGWQARTF